MGLSIREDMGEHESKLRIRRAALALVEGTPVVLEAYGGLGQVYRSLYNDIEQGVVLEKDPVKIDDLVQQRPTWAVYECDTPKALADGAGSHLEINYLDIDPYGDPWPAIEGFFSSDRPRAKRLVIVVTDGMKRKINMGAWQLKSFQDAVAVFGNHFRDRYMEVCKWMLVRYAEKAGYKLVKFAGYRSGHLGQMFHYAGVMERA